MNREEKRAWWRVQVERWRESSLSQSAYCREHGLRLAQFSYWKGRFARLPADEEATLVPVHLLDGCEESTADAGVVVELGTGVSVPMVIVRGVPD